MTPPPPYTRTVRPLHNITSAALALFALAFAVPAAGAPRLEGRWLTDDGKGIVEIAPCGAKLCGHLAKVLDKSPDVPTTDVNNSDPALRKRPLIGLPILTGFEPSGNAWKNGRAYDPKSGNSYKSSLQLLPDGSLKLTGCVLFICESRRWTRAS